MKTIFVSLIAFFFATTLSFGQENSTAAAQKATELVSSKETGKYLFVMPAELTADQVAKSAKYYTHYFTVDFNETSKEAKVTMVINDDKSRHVVMRFLTACGVQNVTVDGKMYSNEDFFNAFMK